MSVAAVKQHTLNSLPLYPSGNQGHLGRPPLHNHRGIRTGEIVPEVEMTEIPETPETPEITEAEEV